MAGNDTRNIALVGHGRSGKTTLAEAILFAAKVVSRQGTIGDKNTVSDFTDDERERGHSIDAALLHAPWKGKDLNITDAPGYPDFVGQALRGLDAADCAIVVVHAYDGVLLNTRRLFHAAGDRGIPRIVVVNRCDSDNIDLGKLGQALDDLCGTAGKAVTVPDAFGASVKRIRSVFGDAAKELKEGFVEAAVEADDALMEKYLEAGEVSDEDLRRAIPLALRKGTLVPIFHTVADKGIGIPELLDFIAEFGPSPVGRVMEDADGNKITCTADGPLRAVCFKVMFERQAGRIAFLRVFSGSIRSGDSAVIARTEELVKIGHPARFQGSAKTEIAQAGIGDIVALPKVDNLAIGDTLHAPGSPVKLRILPLPKPMVGLAVQPKARGDETKLARELERITGADPCLESERVAATNELVVRGLSTLHLDIALKRMHRNGVDVDTSIPKVAYRETINGKADGHYRHKKQTGGAGQFGEVFLKVEPLPRGAPDPLDYVDDVVGGAIPRQFLPAIEKGIRQKMAEGVVAGYPVVDVRVRVYDGKYHDVDSKEIAFIIAGRNAFAEAVQKARPVLLEPVVNVEIEIPSRFMGDITSDLNTRRARISGMDSAGDTQIIKATVPLAEMQTYSTQLRSITAGEGSFHMEFSHYDVVPGNVAQTVIAKAEKKKHPEE
ncbi:MAG: elongation factor G [Planctomycetes bacterium]|nr:elongation factor G [Planctomycetota bacterium]